jgi:hypothetical protein
MHINYRILNKTLVIIIIYLNGFLAIFNKTDKTTNY